MINVIMINAIIINAMMIKTRKKNSITINEFFKNALFVIRFHLLFEFSTFNDFLLQMIHFINEIFQINNDIFRD
jgi:hypothetical protein